MDQTVTLTAATPEALAQAIRLLAAADPVKAEALIRDAGRHLRLVEDGS